MWNLFLLGLVAGVNAAIQFKNIKENKKRDMAYFSKTTMTGALAEYISTPNEKFQPMNANFGILPLLEEKIRDKQKRYEQLAIRAISQIEEKNKYIEMLQKYYNNIKF